MSLIKPLLIAACMLAGAPALSQVGVQQIDIPAPPTEFGRDLRMTLWYPAEPGGVPVSPGENPIFKGAPALRDPALRDAPVAAGRFPLVVLSHGSGSRVEAMGWLATELAKAGFVVAGPNHPGTTSGDSTPAETPKLWQRSADLSAVIDRVTGDPDWSGRVEPAKIGVVGFSLGGATAMLSAGARADLDAYAAYCDGVTQWDCGWYAGGVGYVDGARVAVDKVDLRKLDRDLFQRQNLDPRITAAVLVDPALAQAYDAESLARIAIPMTFINLGDAGRIPAGVDAAALSGQVQNGSLSMVPGASHYSFLAECQDGGAGLLRQSGESEPICDDAGAPSRAALHDQLARMIGAALSRTLKDGA